MRESLTGSHVRRFAPPDCIVYDGPLRPFTCKDRIPLFFNSAQPARVFDPNPVASLNDPSLMDRDDSPSAVPEHAYENATVDVLGPNVRIVDRQAPATAQPDPNAPLLFDRGDDRFEPVNAAFHIDRVQQFLQSLGYTGARQIVPYAIEVDPLALTGADASFFLPSTTQPGHGTLFYGTGGTDDAEDADLVVHEYGHAILEWIAPGTFGGAFASQSRAIGEGFGDYLAFSSHYGTRVASGRDPFCFADWDARCWTDSASENCAYPAGSDCLRRLDSARTMANYETSDVGGVEHRNGQIWSSALREIFLALGRQITDTLVIESLFDAPPHPTFAVMARRLLETDQLLYGGVHRQTICAAMTARQIAVSCDGSPRGELTIVQSADHSTAIPENDPNGIVSRITISDARAIERIGVRVDIEHPSRGDLRIDLVAPDGTRVLLQNVSFELAADIHATFGIDAAAAESLDVLGGRSAAGTWELGVSDLRARDVGRLQSWALVIQFAGDEPQLQRPRGAKSQMIPVVTHVYGVGAAAYASDLRIANVTTAAQTATLIFTRSQEDGTTQFSAVDVHLEPGQTAAFDDVVAGTFFTAGSGSLEILGDVLAYSRLYTPGPNGGTLSQQVPPAIDTQARGEPQLEVYPFEQPRSRLNVGITETAGAPVTVSIQTRERRVVEILPFSHVQVPVSGFAWIDVLEGNGRVAAYLSQIDEATGDAMYIPARGFANGGRWIGPAIGAGRWSTDLRAAGTPATYVSDGQRATASPLGESYDVVRTLYQRPESAGMIATTGVFVYARINAGGTTQFVPFYKNDGPAEQQLIVIENGGGYRTNVGFVAEGPATAEVIVRDAAGAEVQRATLSTPGGVAQIPVSAAVSSGRATVRFLDGKGRAYASLIDARSGDATFVAAQ